MHSKLISTIALLSILASTNAQSHEFYARDTEAGLSLEQVAGHVVHGSTYLHHPARRDLEELAARDPDGKHFFPKLRQIADNGGKYGPGPGQTLKKPLGQVDGLGRRDISLISEISRRKAEAEAELGLTARDPDARNLLKSLGGDVDAGYFRPGGKYDIVQHHRRDIGAISAQGPSKHKFHFIHAASMY